MLKLNLGIEDMLTEYRQYYAFPEPAATNFKNLGWGMFALQAHVARHFMDEGMQLFSLTNKCHFTMESMLLCDKVSPRLLWAFAGEDQMAKTQLLAKSCVKGNNPTQATMKMTQHYRLGLHFTFQEHEKDNNLE